MLIFFKANILIKENVPEMNTPFELKFILSTTNVAKLMINIPSNTINIMFFIMSILC